MDCPAEHRAGAAERPPIADSPRAATVAEKGHKTTFATLSSTTASAPASPPLFSNLLANQYLAGLFCLRRRQSPYKCFWHPRSVLMAAAYQISISSACYR